jgi:hypothetical protein
MNFPCAFKELTAAYCRPATYLELGTKMGFTTVQVYVHVIDVAITAVNAIPYLAACGRS